YLFLFALVLALAYVASRSLRRLAPFARSRHLRLLDQLHLGTTRSFYLLAVANRVVLVAMGEGGVATVATVDDPEQVADLLRQADVPVNAPPGPVADALSRGTLRLRRLWQQRPAQPGQAGQPAQSGQAFAELLWQAQEGSGPARQALPEPGPTSFPAAESAALRQQVERLRRLAERTEG
ncbi:MAG: flagellar biosynthetic protein FliO, partial [Firmicutes bacterium]|nr:flagellar biosynthetic protein FliO [Bacillota bacterium]